MKIKPHPLYLPLTTSQLNNSRAHNSCTLEHKLLVSVLVILEHELCNVFRPIHVLHTLCFKCFLRWKKKTDK